MSFNQFESSEQDGKPTILYEFRIGTTFKRYCGADHDLTVTQQTPDGPVDVLYSQCAISDQGSSQGGGDGNSDELQISIQSDTDIAKLYDGTPPSQTVWVTKRKVHEADADMEAVVTWVGTIGSAVWKDAASKDLSCRTLLASLSAKGLRLCWSRNCMHMLYGPGCTLNGDDFKFDAPLYQVQGDSVGIRVPATLPVAPFSGGYFEWTDDDGLLHTRSIYKFDGSFFVNFPCTCYVLGDTAGLTVGQVVTVFPGCDRTDDEHTGCGAFDNTVNFGGFKYQPGKSPFNGDPVF